MLRLTPNRNIQIIFTFTFHCQLFLQTPYYPQNVIHQLTDYINQYTSGMISANQ
jgi:hypothetical protein